MNVLLLVAIAGGNSRSLLHSMELVATVCEKKLNFYDKYPSNIR